MSTSNEAAGLMLEGFAFFELEVIASQIFGKAFIAFHEMAPFNVAWDYPPRRRGSHGGWLGMPASSPFCFASATARILPKDAGFAEAGTACTA